MNYQFGAARKLYEDGVHPRIYLGPGDIPKLREICRRDDGQKIMASLRQRVGPIIRSVLDAEDLVSMIAAWNQNWHMPGTRAVGALQDIAMVGVLDTDADAVEVVRRLLAICPDVDKAGRQEGVRRLRYSALGTMAKAYDLIHSELSVEARGAFCDWAFNQGVLPILEMLLPNYFKGAAGNMNIGGMSSSIMALLAISREPGMPDTTTQLDQALLMFEATLNAAIGPDGYPEEDIGYGTGVTAGLALLAEPLRRAGIFDVYKQCPRYARFGNAILHFVQPWGQDLSNTGDHGDDFGNREFVLARLATETNDPALLWLLGTLSYDHGRVLPENKQPQFYREVALRKGFQAPATTHSLLVMDTFKQTAPPAHTKAPTAFCGRDRGIVSFRSGWGHDDTFVVFDGSQRSPAGQGHAHASCGHFSISALGEYFAIDTGRYNNEQNCHSVVLIDGKSGRSTDGEWMAMKHHGMLTHYEPGEFVDFAGVDSSHQHNCQWARRYLGLVKGKEAPAYVWVVDDINKADDWAEYHWQLQTSPENTISIEKDQATIAGWQHGNLLDVHLVLPSPEEYPKPHRILGLSQDTATPSSYKYIPSPQDRAKDYVRPAAMVHGPVFARPRLLLRIGGYNGRFMTLMLPRTKDGEPPAVQRLESVPTSLAVRVSFPEVEDTIIFAHEHRLLEAADVKGRGHWCVVRRDRQSGRIIHHAISEGTSLAADGKQLNI